MRFLLVVLVVGTLGCPRRHVATPEEARAYHQLDWSIESEPRPAAPEDGANPDDSRRGQP